MGSAELAAVAFATRNSARVLLHSPDCAAGKRPKRRSRLSRLTWAGVLEGRLTKVPHVEKRPNQKAWHLTIPWRYPARAMNGRAPQPAFDTLNRATPSRRFLTSDGAD